MSSLPLSLRELEAAQRAGVASAFAAQVNWLEGETWHDWSVSLGERRRTPPPVQPLERGSQFDLASLTKAFVSATLAGLYWERGWLDWEAPIGRLLPLPAASAWVRGQVTVGQLLTHTAGAPAWLPLWQGLEQRSGAGWVRLTLSERRAAYLEAIGELELESRPGERVLYSDVGFMLLGWAIEEIGGDRLDRLFAQQIAGPLGIGGLQFVPTTGRGDDVRARARALQDERAVATEDCPWRGLLLQGQVHDENCWALGGVAGHAGLWGTIDAVSALGRAYLTPWWSERVRRQFWRIGEWAGTRRAGGWDAPSLEGSQVGASFSRASVGHWGFTGTSVWIDPSRKLVATLLTNRVHPTRNSTGIRTLRPAFHDAVIADLAERLRAR